MNNGVSLFLKGLAMGSANVIPGVSGGTIALITGIYERLINAMKRCDIQAAKLLLKGNFKGLWQHIDGAWLVTLSGGIAVSIVSLARLFEYVLANHETYIMAFFFGLIVISVAFVAKRVHSWNASTILSLMVGTAIAVSIAMLAPASENDHWLYVFLCGAVAISSMILPGLSGSFVLILMGNYALVLGAINTLSLDILVPLAAGCGFGLIAFSHIISWVFKRYPNQTLALMTGFVIGSLVVIWPWKNAIIEIVHRADKEPRQVITAYEWFLPQLMAPSTWIALGLMLLGAAAIALLEVFSGEPEPSH